jgi:hypothetical protein
MVEQLKGNHQMELRREQLAQSRLLNNNGQRISGDGACWSSGSVTSLRFKHIIFTLIIIINL